MTGGASAYKASGRLGVALPAGGGLRLTENGARVLEALASSRLPLGASELLARTGLRRRTLFWWLARLVEGGFVQRIGRKRCPGAVYSITWEGLRLLASYRSNFERVQRHLRTAVSGAARALRGGGFWLGEGGCGGGATALRSAPSGAAAVSAAAAAGVGVSAGGSPASAPSAASRGNGGVARERAALCVYRGGRWVPVVELGLVNASDLLSRLAAGGGRLRVPWWVVADGGNGFREVGFRASWRRLRRLLRLLGVEVPKRVKRVVVYAKGKEVHVDAATRVPLDEIVAVGPYAARHQYLLAFAGSALALLAAGFDRRFLQLVVALLEPA